MGISSKQGNEREAFNVGTLVFSISFSVGCYLDLDPIQEDFTHFKKQVIV